MQKNHLISNAVSLISEQKRDKYNKWFCSIKLSSTLNLKSKNSDKSKVDNICCSKYEASKYPVWIISDARRLTDLQFFRYLIF
jgi:hypothetical protein